MKRLLIASALLISLLVGTVVNAQVLGALTGELTDLLGQAQLCTRQSRWDDALDRTQTALRIWNRNSFYLHVVTRHGDADQIQQGLATAVQLLERHSGAEYAHVNTELRVQLELLAEMEQPTLSNIL